MTAQLPQDATNSPSRVGQDGRNALRASKADSKVPAKWVIEKCRRQPRKWHVYAPCAEHDDYCADYVFSTGARAIEFVASEVTNQVRRSGEETSKEARGL